MKKSESKSGETRKTALPEKLKALLASHAEKAREMEGFRASGKMELTRTYLLSGSNWWPLRPPAN